MAKLIRRTSKAAGLPPGTLIHIGKKKIEKPRIKIMNYDESNCEEREIENVKECYDFKDAGGVTWINVDGIHQINILEQIGNCFGLHPLVMEDILNTEQRPKIDDLGNYIFLVSKMLYFDRANHIESEQVSLILGRKFVISFQEREGDVFNSIRERISKGKGRIRKMGPDYPAYSLLDAIVDHYFVMLENLGSKIEEIEDELVSNPTTETMNRIHKLKRQIILLRKSIWPFREVIGIMEREQSQLIQESTLIYLRDIHDHIIQVIDTIETYREMLSGMVDIYLSSISNKMNQVMKVLTIIATIFIPLTFIAGIYGMNFKYTPELEWQFSYPLILASMLIAGSLMLYYFRRKNWL